MARPLCGHERLSSHSNASDLFDTSPTLCNHSRYLPPAQLSNRGVLVRAQPDDRVWPELDVRVPRIIGDTDETVRAAQCCPCPLAVMDVFDHDDRPLRLHMPLMPPIYYTSYPFALRCCPAITIVRVLFTQLHARLARHHFLLYSFFHYCAIVFESSLALLYLSISS